MAKSSSKGQKDIISGRDAAQQTSLEYVPSELWISFGNHLEVSPRRQLVLLTSEGRAKILLNLYNFHKYELTCPNFILQAIIYHFTRPLVSSLAPNMHLNSKLSPSFPNRLLHILIIIYLPWQTCVYMANSCGRERIVRKEVLYICRRG